MSLAAESGSVSACLGTQHILALTHSILGHLLVRAIPSHAWTPACSGSSPLGKTVAFDSHVNCKSVQEIASTATRRLLVETLPGSPRLDRLAGAFSITGNPYHSASWRLGRLSCPGWRDFKKEAKNRRAKILLDRQFMGAGGRGFLISDRAAPLSRLRICRQPH